MAKAKVEYPFVQSDGVVALIAADDDYFYLDTAITAGSDQDITGSLAQTVAKYARNVTFTKTDGDSSLTQMKVWLTGLNEMGDVIQETLTLTVGTATDSSNYAYHELTSVIYHADGSAGGADKLKIGFGDVLGLPREIDAVSDVLRARMDTTVYNDVSSGAGTWSATYQTWEPVSAPNGARTYYMSVAETI